MLVSLDVKVMGRVRGRLSVFFLLGGVMVVRCGSPGVPPGELRGGIDGPPDAGLESPLNGGVARGADAVAGWVEPGWVSAVTDPEVRRLLFLNPGVDLIEALQGLPGGRCRADHGQDGVLAWGPVVVWEGPDGPGRTLVGEGEAAPGEPCAALAVGQVPGAPCACQLAVAAGWLACAGWVQEQVSQVTVAVAGTGPLEIDPGRAGAIVDPVGEELAAVWHVSVRTAGSRIRAARDRHQCRALVPAVQSGVLSASAFSAVCDVLAGLPSGVADRLAGVVHERVLRRRAAGRRNWTPAQARRCAREVLLTHAGELVADLEKAARSQRRVDLQPNGDGTSWLHALLPEVEALRIYRRLSARAHAQAADADQTDSRSIDQRRSDLFVETFLTSSPHADTSTSSSAGSVPELGSGPGTGLRPGSGAASGASSGGAVEVCVVASVETLLGLCDTPGYVPGLGPVSADTARELAADGTWRAWLTDAAGIVTAVGTAGYRPSAGLARMITAREPTCRFPGCTVPAALCDLDHAVPWPAPPGTTPENLGPLCRRHHRLKTHLGHQLATDLTPDGQPVGWTWTLPSGLTHIDHFQAPLNSADTEPGHPAREPNNPRRE